jgi:hypothetical protein
MMETNLGIVFKETPFNDKPCMYTSKQAIGVQGVSRHARPRLMIVPKEE